MCAEWFGKVCYSIYKLHCSCALVLLLWAMNECVLGCVIDS